MTEFTTVNGYQWPAADVYCQAVVFNEVGPALERVLPLVRDFSACVQAGGNCGVWANALAQRFDAVYTFEPHPVNFACLAHNCPSEKIIKLQVALGMGHEPPIRTATPKADNLGAVQVVGEGIVPVLALDALHLPKLGLLYLDIEGFEPMALRGAVGTIQRCRPVIALEQKGLERYYGFSQADIDQIMTECNYREIDRFARDVVYVPC